MGTDSLTVLPGVSTARDQRMPAPLESQAPESGQGLTTKDPTQGVSLPHP